MRGFYHEGDYMGILDGLDAAGDAVEAAISNIITNAFQVFRDNIMGGLYDNLLSVVLGTLDDNAGFMILFSCFLLAFFLKFIYWPLRS